VLTSVVGDPNTSIHENKALTCSLRKGRLAKGIASAEREPGVFAK
jgi:formate dehydrogenase major subunit